MDQTKEKASLFLDKKIDFQRQNLETKEEQARGIGQINSSITGVNSTVQENAASAEESASAAEKMSAQAEEMQGYAEQLASLIGGNGSPKALLHSAPPRKGEDKKGSSNSADWRRL